MEDPLIGENQHAFLEQKLPMKRLVLSPNLYIVVFTPIGLICLVIGAVLLFAKDSAIEVKKDYSNICEIGNVCEFILNIPQRMSYPIAVMFELTNFYQNHWKSVRSRSDDQLMGKYVRFDDMKSCYPYRSNGDDPSPNNWILPCGLHAISFFNDTFDVKEFKTLELSDVQQTGIKVKSLNSLYKGHKWLEDTPSWPNSNTLNRFSMWMDTAAFPNFRRLYGIAQGKGYVEPGNVTISVMNNYNVSSFNGKKSIILTTKGDFPPSSKYLGIVYIVSGTIMEIASLITIFTKPIFTSA
ncbi:hypothetical protein TVAG_182490 [Trichomonas vaginalis G3]|uniref:Cell cycle control protein 50A n=1 Tax=Trichomonas vaginalis (strain ATCC PRA-98 / G3) TaxID=412133 RepID=A2D8Y7_TRIV3|nr:aminophospholipid transmembrane transporter protein [Trichomonas vaginalis G3]EAY23013.1 hypothetical protein TVAG_182490 [Trichomonas vaginalis G3]KAI5518972.1 aminophospholipid transmembrane transporter protein [Trichomonas vaginalis G3]|eukprot:XP_001583999.1 hypothetical protein [Trichomonas vaginalis G3]